MATGSEILAREMPRWLSGGLILGAFAAIVLLERKRPLRRVTQAKIRRDSRNLAVAVISATAVRLTEKPLAATLTLFVHRRRWGVVKWTRLPVWLELTIGTILLDYTLYVWHVLTHKVGFLWRFHRVHHADLELDASTALRFHFVEMVLSAPWRAAQVLLIGASPLTLSLWQTVTLLAILFHHSNVRLPIALERRLCRLIMTPRMHGIHHSMIRRETDSNWSTILAFPDYLHRTACLTVPQQAVPMGIPAYRDPAELELAELLAMPFGKQRATWKIRGDGDEPRRQPRPIVAVRSRLAE